KDDEANGWRFTSPEVDFAVDTGEMSRFMGVATRLNAAGFADGTQASSVGLEPPLATMTLTAGAEEHILHIGKVGEEEGVKYYVRRDDGSYIYEIGSHHGEQLTRRVSSFRDRVPRRLNKDLVERIIFPGDDAIVLERRDGEFRVARPSVSDPTALRVTGLVNHVTGLRTERYVDLSPSEAGLDGRGQTRVVINTSEGTHTLLLGRHLEGESGPRYARFFDDDTVFVLTEHNTNQLFPRASEFEGDGA
ncbi:MAG: DUF4340 domain-containing protein, partial [Bradymonadaceae bacterium]